MYSSILAEMDHNTELYMIEEMKKELEAKSKEIETKSKELAILSAKLKALSTENEILSGKITALNALLDTNSISQTIDNS